VIWDPNWFMPAQAYSFTCSVCSLTWVLQATDTAHQEDDIYDARYAVGERMGYPDCVNQTYGCMSDQCVIDTLASYSLVARQAYVTFDVSRADPRYRIFGGGVAGSHQGRLAADRRRGPGEAALGAVTGDAE
jgi:hypothetical protein